MNSAAEKWKAELQKSIDMLKEILKELKAISAHPPGPSAEEKSQQRDEIFSKMFEINRKIDTLQAILRHIKPSEVVIPGVTPEDAAALNTAIEELNQEIEREKQFNNILNAATKILDAVNKVYP